MKSRSTSDSTSKLMQTQTPAVEENISRRAYELYEQRGRSQGRDLDDWLQAEQN